MKTHSLKRTGAEKAASKDALGSPSLSTDEDGADLHLEGDHLKKMDVDAGLPHGHDVTFQGHGTVHRSSDGPEGGRMHIKVHRMGMEYDEPQDEKEKSLRSEISKNTEESETKRDTKKFTKKAAKADETGEE